MCVYNVLYEIFPITLHRKGCFQKLVAVVGYVVPLTHFICSDRENAQRLSRIFKDQPQKPLDAAIYWTEYVIRHRGAVHLRSGAADLNAFVYYSNFPTWSIPHSCSLCCTEILFNFFLKNK
jgi:hypothetical protein